MINKLKRFSGRKNGLWDAADVDAEYKVPPADWSPSEDVWDEDKTEDED